MRGNSGFLRLAVVGWMLVCSVLGGPPRPRRMMRETFSSSIQDSVPISFNITQGSDICMNNGKEVLRSTVTCEKKNGCREIETHGECCPKFLCECKLNGTIYDNGDKIVDPENPCEVCVCRGGDINCNTLKCYSRNDCRNVTYMPGVCCPEYVNCPPLENVQLSSSNETTTEYSSIDYHSSTTFLTPLPTTETTTTTTAQSSTQSHDNSVGIKIKEITKPEEIRITDDRPKIFKTIKSSEVIPTKTSTSLHSTEAFIEPDSHTPLSPLAIIPYENTEMQLDIQAEFQPEIQPEIQPENQPGNQPDNHPEYQTEIQSEDHAEIHQEIEPEIEQHTTYTLDGSADQPIQLYSTDLNTVGDTSVGPKIVRQTDQGIEEEVHTTIAPLSSENEIKDDDLSTRSNHVTEAPVESTSAMHNTSVLQVGDSVVIFDRSGQTQSIPLRVAGLQRGEDTYDEDDERKEGRKPDDNMQHSTPGFFDSSSTDMTFDESASTQVYEVFYYEPKDMTVDFPSSEIYTASDEGFINGSETNDFKEPLVSTEAPSIEVTSEKYLEDVEDSSGYSPLENLTDRIMSPSTVYEQILNINDSYEGSSSTSDEVPTTSEYILSSTGSSQFYSSEPTTEDDDIVQHDQNINFPHITDDLSIHGSRMEDRIEDEEKVRVNSRIVEGELEEDIKYEQNNIILPEVLPNTSSFEFQSTVAPFEAFNESSNFNDVEGRAPGEPFLIPEWERNHTTVAPFELLVASNETTEDYLLAELSSHPVDPINGDESTTNQPDVSSSTDFIETNPSTSESDQNYGVESREAQQTSGQSQVKETNNFNLFLDGTSDFFRIQKKIWDSAVA